MVSARMYILLRSDKPPGRTNYAVGLSVRRAPSHLLRLVDLTWRAGVGYAVCSYGLGDRGVGGALREVRECPATLLLSPCVVMLVKGAFAVSSGWGRPWSPWGGTQSWSMRADFFRWHFFKPLEILSEACPRTLFPWRGGVGDRCLKKEGSTGRGARLYMTCIRFPIFEGTN